MSLPRRAQGGCAFRVCPQPQPAFVVETKRSRPMMGLALILGVPAAFLAVVGVLWLTTYLIKGAAWVALVWAAVLS